VKALVVLVLLVLLGRAAHAQPWAEGVTDKNQNAAQALFADANKLFAQEAHGPALEKYVQAIALWDHPLIRFNMAVTLVRLDRFLDAALAIDRALRFGQAPFPTPEQYRQALDYQKLVGGRVGELEVTCAQAGVQVTLDGKQWLACPATQKLRVLAGEHALVAEAKDHMTKSQRLVVTGGKTTTASVELLRIETVATYEHPTRRWIPWTVAGGGAGLAAIGVAIWFSGRSQMDDFDENFARECPAGCDLDDAPALRDQRDGAQFKGNLGAAMVIGGGAVLAGGVVWAVVFNKPQRVLPTVEATPQGATLGASWRW
jgi:hypothetical protein